jgi:TIR domain
MAFDAFISHSSKDKQAADATCAALEQAGIRCWIAPRDVRAGHEYAEEIIRAIDSCRVMVLIFSSRANDSNQVRREIERAVSKAITIVTLRIEDVMPTKSMELYLNSIHWLDAITPPLTRHLQRLVEQVKANLDVDGRSEGPVLPLGAFGDPKRISAKGADKTFAFSNSRKWQLAAGGLVLIALAAIAGFMVLRDAGAPKPITKLDGTFVGTYKTTQLAKPRQVFARFVQQDKTIVATFETTSLVYGAGTGTMTSKIEGTLDHVELQSPRCTGLYQGTVLLSGTSISLTVTGKNCLGPDSATGVLFRSPVADDIFEAFRKRREGFFFGEQGNLDGAFAAYKDGSAILLRVIAKDPDNEMWQQDKQEQADGIGSLAVDFVTARKYPQALDAADLAISLSPEILWLYIVKAEALMLLNRTDEARALFLKYAGEQNVYDNKSWQIVVVGFFADLRKAGVQNPLMDEIEKRFQAGG